MVLLLTLLLVVLVLQLMLSLLPDLTSSTAAFVCMLLFSRFYPTRNSFTWVVLHNNNA
jgi:hypothetical protein